MVLKRPKFNVQNLILIMSIICFGISIYSNFKWYSYAYCQAQVNEQLVATINARSEANSQSQQSVDELFEKILQLKPGQGPQVNLILKEYLAERREAEAQRAANPFPQPGTCRDVAP